MRYQVSFHVCMLSTHRRSDWLAVAHLSRALAEQLQRSEFLRCCFCKLPREMKPSFPQSVFFFSLFCKQLSVCLSQSHPALQPYSPVLLHSWSLQVCFTISPFYCHVHTSMCHPGMITGWNVPAHPNNYFCNGTYPECSLTVKLHYSWHSPKVKCGNLVCT